MPDRPTLQIRCSSSHLYLDVEIIQPYVVENKRAHARYRASRKRSKSHFDLILKTHIDNNHRQSTTADMGESYSPKSSFLLNSSSLGFIALVTSDSTCNAWTLAQRSGLQLNRITRKLTKLQTSRYRSRQTSCAQHASQSAKKRQRLPQATREAVPLPSTYVLIPLRNPLPPTIYPHIPPKKAITYPF